MSAPHEKRPPAAPDATIPVVLVGLDERARIVARALLAHPELRLVAAVGGKGETLPEAAELPILSKASEAFRRARGGVAVLCRGGRLEEIEADLFAAIEAGLSVVGIPEELIHAPFVDPDLAERIDEAAARREVAILGVGLYAGFFFDRFAATAASVVGAPERLEAERIVDAAGRGISEIAGVGRRERAFDAGVEKEEIGQRGLSEACGLVAEALGLDVDEVEEVIDPILADRDVEIAGRKVAKGEALGCRQIARGFLEGKELVRLSVRMELGAPSEDRLRVEGTPPLEVVIPGGLPEDPALGWAVANAIPLLEDLPPGLRSVLDLPSA